MNNDKKILMIEVRRGLPLSLPSARARARIKMMLVITLYKYSFLCPLISSHVLHLSLLFIYFLSYFFNKIYFDFSLNT